MMDKKKKIKGVWILAGVLILLLAVYYAMRAWNQNREGTAGGSRYRSCDGDSGGGYRFAEI